MNTTAHAILNAYVLRKNQVHVVWPLLGAFLPDVPAFLFYFIKKFIEHLPDKKIWSKHYHGGGWENIFDLFHSIPVLLILGIIFWLAYQNLNHSKKHIFKIGIVICLSMLLHCFMDFVTHATDAHRHFWPFSQYKFISPISYWDVRYYSRIYIMAEIPLLVFLWFVNYRFLKGRIAKNGVRNSEIKLWWALAGLYLAFSALAFFFVE